MWLEEWLFSFSFVNTNKAILTNGVICQYFKNHCFENCLGTSLPFRLSIKYIFSDLIS